MDAVGVDEVFAPRPSAEVSARMAVYPRRDTRPEVALRSRLHADGLRFRLHRRVVPGAPRREVDIVFSRERVAVNVHGCFWHGCPTHARLDGTSAAAWWRRKLKTNVERDRDTRRRLE